MEEQDSTIEPEKLLSDFENFIRHFIHSALKDTYPISWTDGIPNSPGGASKEGMLDKWKKRRGSARDKGMTTKPNLIYQAEFADYRHVIEYRKNREIFSEIFGPANKNKLSVYLEDITDFRNKIRHSKGDASKEEIYHIQYEIDWIKTMAGRKYPLLLTDRGFKAELHKPLSFELKKVSPDIKIYFRDLLNRYLENSEDGEQEEAQNSFNEIIKLIEKEIDKHNKDNILFILEGSFLEVYPHIYLKLYPHAYDPSFFILHRYFDLIKYAYKQNKQLQIDILDAFDNILDREVYSNEDEKKVKPIADLFLNVGIYFLDIEPEVSQRCFYNLINSSEDMLSSALFSDLVLAGAILARIQNPPEKVKNLRDEVIASIEDNDLEAKSEGFFNYLKNTCSYLDVNGPPLLGKTSDEEKDIYFSLNEFYDKYLEQIIDRNENQRLIEYIDYLDRASCDPERDTDELFKSFEKFLSEVYEEYEEDSLGITDKISKILSKKIKESKNNEFKNILDEFEVMEGTHVSNLIKKARESISK